MGGRVAVCGAASVCYHRKNSISGHGGQMKCINVEMHRKDGTARYTGPLTRVHDVPV